LHVKANIRVVFFFLSLVYLHFYVVDLTSSKNLKVIHRVV